MLIPRLLVPRLSLPLVYLDSQTDSYGSTGSRLFSASEKTLKALAGSSQQAQEPKVLIAQHDGGHRLYAVEFVREGIYALCRLSDWVGLKDFGKPPTKAKKISHGDHATTVAGDSQWWRKAALVTGDTIRTTERRPEIQGIRLALKPPSNWTPLTTTTDLPIEPADASNYEAIKVEDVSLDALKNGEARPQPPATDSGDVLGIIRVQYLEALYINKVTTTCAGQANSTDAT